MPNTTTNYSLYKPLVADPIDEDLWGGYLNDDMDDIDSLLKQGITLSVQSSQTTGFTATSTISVKYFYPCDATGGAFAATLPTAAAAGNGATVFFQKTDASANAVTITRASSDTIDGATTFALSARYSIAGLVSDGVSKWSKIASTDALFTGDSGSGGASGLVPAPASGSAAKRYMLGAGGSFTSQTCVQRVSTQTGAVATGTTVIPYDDSIPQNTEGDEYMTIAITPKDAANKLVIDVVVNLSNNAGGTLISALFQDSTASALAAAATYIANNGFMFQLTFRHVMTAGTTSATTFKVRAGNSSAGTTTFNGENGSRLFGGVFASSIMITEYSE